MKLPESNSIIESVINSKNDALSKCFGGADIIALKSPIIDGLDNFLRLEIEELHDTQLNRKKRRHKTLVIVLETEGGSIEVVERIYAVLRQHYKTVNFIVPNFAYSAGTLLVLSGDNIYMDYYSVLGPIDPQIEAEDGKFIPGLGILQKYTELVTKINANPPDATRAELNYLINKFDPGILFFLEQAKKHAEDLLIQWLPKHKFKDWKFTKTKRKKVTSKMRKDRAKEIAEILGNPEEWHSHGRGIGMTKLRGDKIKLKIHDPSENEKLYLAMREYYNILFDFCGKVGCRYFIHSSNGLRGMG